METYDDWQDVKGLGFMGDASIFPHMDDTWENLIQEKKTNAKYESVIPLRQWEAFCVDGETMTTFLYEGDH